MSNENKIIPLDEYLDKASRNKLSPREAQDLDRALLAEGPPEGIFAPICLASPSDVAPIAYVMHNWLRRCTNCGTEHRWSEVFALNHLRSRSGSTFIRHLVPVTKLEWQVPMHIHSPVSKTTPYCFECAHKAAIHGAALPRPPVPQIPHTTRPPKEAAAQPHRKAPPTLEDIL